MPELPRSLIVSFHDLHPGSRSACERFLQMAAEAGVPNQSLLVVPRWHGSPPFDLNSEFVDWLRGLAEEGHDLCLHGNTHTADVIRGGLLAGLMARYYTNREGEFYQLNRQEARHKISDGLERFEKAGLSVHGFTAPAWLINEDGRTILRQLGFHYNTRFSRVEFLQDGDSIHAPTLVFSCRSAWRRVISVHWTRFWMRFHRKTRVLRLAVHPGDLEHPAIVDAVRDLLKKTLSNRQPTTYRDLLNRSAASLSPTR